MLLLSRRGGDTGGTPKKTNGGFFGRMSNAITGSSSSASRAQSTGPQLLSRPSPLTGSQEEPVIIFDWDDTLCPTWFIKHVVLQSCATSSGGGAADAQKKQDDQFSKPLADHTRVVMETLRQARKVAKVGIVTLAHRPWVEMSIADFLKGCGLKELLQELGIEFFFAELPDKVKPGEPPGVTAKKVAITECINKLHNGGQLNVMSIGDSMCEAEATREVMRTAPKNRLCKTVKLAENPWLTELTEDLKKLQESLVAMATHTKDFDCIGCTFPEGEPASSSVAPVGAAPTAANTASTPLGRPPGPSGSKSPATPVTPPARQPLALGAKQTSGPATKQSPAPGRPSSARSSLGNSVGRTSLSAERRDRSSFSAALRA